MLKEKQTQLTMYTYKYICSLFYNAGGGFGGNKSDWVVKPETRNRINGHVGHVG